MKIPLLCQGHRIQNTMLQGGKVEHEQSNEQSGSRIQKFNTATTKISMET